MKSKRRNHSAQFEANVALEAAKGDKTVPGYSVEEAAIGVATGRKTSRSRTT